MTSGTVGNISPGVCEEHLNLIKRLLFDGFSGGNLDVVEEVFHPDIEFNSPGLNPGIAGIKEIVAKNNAALKPWQFHIDDMIGDGKKTAVRWHAEGTHVGSFMGEEPTHENVLLRGLVIYEIEGGQIIRNWMMDDKLGFLQQLGVLPKPPHRK